LKIYLDSAIVLAKIESLLVGNRPAFHYSPLYRVIDVLCHDRHYGWAGIYLTAGRTNAQLLGAGGEPHPGQMARPETKSKILISLKLAGRELGVLDVESDRENAFGSKDRVLLENVAQLLARFLAGPGKYIARKARTAAMA
jgi:putative methionine-R-sulfoxide reductase with GAF domain